MNIQDFNHQFDELKENKILNFLEKEIGFENYGSVFKRDLKRIENFFKPLVLKFKNSKVITVAGTNGKGGTCKKLSKLFLDNKIDHCVWSSPHIFSICERIRFGNHLISYDEFNEIILEVKELCFKEKTILSFYEFLFACFLIFSIKRGPSFLILEVGLGGRLDATNFFSADLVLLTSIARDHQEFLGNRLSDILKEKLGLIRRNSWCISTLNSKYLRTQASEICFKNETYYLDLFNANLVSSEDDYESNNLKLALSAYQHFLGKPSVNKIPLSKYSDTLYLKTKVRFDGSHNPEAFRSLVKKLCKSGEFFDWILLGFSKRRSSDLETMLASILAYIRNNSTIYITNFSHFKAMNDQEFSILKNKFSTEKRIVFIDSWKDFLGIKLNSKEEQKCLISGSNYFMGQTVKYFNTLSK